METDRYVRKVLHVEAVRITDENFFEVAGWCQGLVFDMDTGKRLVKWDEADPLGIYYIRVRVHFPQSPRHTKGYVGDWILYTDAGGYKVYSDRAFRGTFEKAAD